LNELLENEIGVEQSTKRAALVMMSAAARRYRGCE
jgi:hypothetical protein